MIKVWPSFLASSGNEWHCGRGEGWREFECTNALAAAAKRPSIVLDVRGRGNGLWDLIPLCAKNATERESVRVLSVPGRVYHHTQTDEGVRKNV
jgi:hypothetical protein